MNYESRQRYTNEFSGMTGLITLVGASSPLWWASSAS